MFESRPGTVWFRRARRFVLLPFLFALYMRPGLPVSFAQTEPTPPKPKQVLLYSDDRTTIFGASDSPSLTDTTVFFHNKMLENCAWMKMTGEGLRAQELSITYLHDVMNSVSLDLGMLGRSSPKLGLTLCISKEFTHRIQHDFNIDGVWDFAVDTESGVDSGIKVTCYLWLDGQWQRSTANTIPMDDEPMGMVNGVEYVFRGDKWGQNVFQPEDEKRHSSGAQKNQGITAILIDVGAAGSAAR